MQIPEDTPPSEIWETLKGLDVGTRFVHLFECATEISNNIRYKVDRLVKGHYELKRMNEEKKVRNSNYFKNKCFDFDKIRKELIQIPPNIVEKYYGEGKPFSTYFTSQKLLESITPQYFPIDTGDGTQKNSLIDFSITAELDRLNATIRDKSQVWGPFIKVNYKNSLHMEPEKVLEIVSDLDLDMGVKLGKRGKEWVEDLLKNKKLEKVDYGNIKLKRESQHFGPYGTPTKFHGSLHGFSGEIEITPSHFGTTKTTYDIKASRHHIQIPEEEQNFLINTINTLSKLDHRK
jgi:hypothetical protein